MNTNPSVDYTNHTDKADIRRNVVHECPITECADEANNRTRDPDDYGGNGQTKHNEISKK